MIDQSSLIADTIHGSIMLSRFEKDIMTTTLFNRLHGIYQNSTAYLTFPSNRTRRIEHSLGTMYLCGEMFYASICNAEKEVVKKLLEITKQELDDILTQIRKNGYGDKYDSKLGGAIKRIKERYDTLCISGGIYNYYTPANILGEENRKLYALLFEGVRVAALLHDIGHPPFSHVSEDALNIIYDRLKKKETKNKKEQEFWDIMEPLVGDKHQLHEEMGNKIAELLLLGVIPELDCSERNVPEKYHKQIYKILVKEIAMAILSEKTSFFKDIHAVIDGTLDGDRLDYVSRDPMNSGFKQGITEYDRLSYKMKLCYEKSKFLFCPDISVVKTVEDFLMRRWNMYKNIIFHHRVVKTDSLLKNSIVEIAEAYFASDDNEEEDTSCILPYDISGLWKANKLQPSKIEQTYALSQWDDTWLLTILKKSYFERYIEENNYMHDQLEEFLTNQRNYISLVKRQEDFEEIDTEVVRVLCERKEELEHLIEKLQAQSKKVDSKTGDEKTFDIQGYLKGIKDVLDSVSSANEEKQFILCIVNKKLFPKKVLSFLDVLDKTMKEMEKEKGEFIYAVKQPKTGTNKKLFFYRKKNEQDSFEPLDKVSNITNVLEEDLKSMPFLYLYMGKRGLGTRTTVEVRNEIGTKLGNNIVDCVLEKLNSFLNRDDNEGEIKSE